MMKLIAHKAVREYRFRAWDTNEQKMIDSDSVAFENYEPLIILLNDSNLKLMQCTGFKDSNGILIYEGDIIIEGCNGLIGVVVWDNNLATYHLDGLGEDYIIKDAPVEWKILSNIYENPELIPNY